MLGSFAVFALILAVVGVYGVLAHLVAQGTQDIGVRMTLGADRAHILRMVLRQGLELAIAGVVLGLIGSYALTRVMTSLRPWRQRFAPTPTATPSRRPCTSVGLQEAQTDCPRMVTRSSGAKGRRQTEQALAAAMTGGAPVWGRTVP